MSERKAAADLTFEELFDVIQARCSYYTIWYGILGGDVDIHAMRKESRITHRVPGRTLRHALVHLVEILEPERG